MNWQTTPPDMAGVWRLHCSEAEQTELVTVVVRGDSLWAENCEVGSLPVGDLHNGLTSPQWKFERPLIASAVTAEDVAAAVVGETFTVLPSGKVMVCELTLKNGFTVRGESAVVSKENFVFAKGQEISRRRAMDKVWELEGYLLQEKRYLANS